jgi:hypothetical protein
MLLSHRYQFLYVHIAKTGGTSVRAALNKLRWRDPLYYLTFPAHKISAMTGHKLGLKFPRHSHIIAAKEMLPAEYFDSLFKLAVVRNPWDLQVSSFHHIHRERPEVMNGITDFNEFMRYKLDPDRPYQYHIDTSLSLQSDYLIDLHGNICVDFIAKYEQLQEDFNYICEQLKLPKIVLPHQRHAASRDPNYRTYYDDDVIEAVARHFAADADSLAYQF